MKLRGKLRQILNKRTQKWEVSWYPDTREKALEEDIVFYYPAGDPPCDVPTHRAGTSVVYTISDKQKCCAIDDAFSAWIKARDSDEPISADMAREQGLDYYWTQHPGKYCGHLGKVTLNGRCWECLQMRLNSPRKIALRSGQMWYMPTPGDTCPRGHHARRRVANGSCEECERLARIAKPSQEPSIMELCPDLIISRVDAATAGFKMYRTGTPCRAGHTGWRYVSTGNCISCMGR